MSAAVRSEPAIQTPPRDSEMHFQRCGDRRAFHLLGKLTRKYGCGANKRADCYACLRSGTDLDAAMKAVKARREPHPFGG